MNDLRKAAEMALKDLTRLCHAQAYDTVEALRQALDLQTTIERGTKAWADVPNATEWVDELRGNDTPEVTWEVPCKTHPDAPHGFDRNASHSADRYVCECEGWEPVDNVYMSEERVHKSDKSMHEHVDWEAVAADQAMTIAMMQIENKKEWVGLTNEQIYEHRWWDEAQIYEHRWWDEETAFAVNKELKEKNIAPYAKNDTSDRVLHKEWVGLTADEIWKCNKAETGSAVEFHICSAHQNVMDFAEAIEAKLKEKNGG